jgi:hypothetical protein
MEQSTRKVTEPCIHELTNTRVSLCTTLYIFNLMKYKVKTQTEAVLCDRKLRVSQLVPERPKSMFEHPIITKDRQRTSSDTLVLQQTDSGHTAIRYSSTPLSPARCLLVKAIARLKGPKHEIFGSGFFYTNQTCTGR